MRKNLLFFAVTVVGFAAFLLTLSSCGANDDADRKVEALVEYMQTDSFNDEIAKADLFTGSEVVVNDSVVELTLNTIEGIRINALSAGMLATQQEGLRHSLITSYRAALPADKICREGFEGLRDKKMALKITLRDTQGATASVSIAPEEVLE